MIVGCFSIIIYFPIINHDSPLYFHHRVHWLLRKYEDWPDDWANEDDGAEVQQDVPKKIRWDMVGLGNGGSEPPTRMG